MRRPLATLLALAGLLAFAAAPAAAQEEGFGFERIGISFLAPDGQPYTQLQAGSHPFAMRTELELRTRVDPELGFEVGSGQLRDLDTLFSPGMTGSPFAVPQCESADFATKIRVKTLVGTIENPGCSDASVVGLVENRVSLADGTVVKSVNPVYNLVPPPGVAARLAFLAYGGPVPPTAIDIGIADTPPFNLIARVRNVTQMVNVFDADLTVWGNPASPAHDGDRGRCGLFLEINGFPAELAGEVCPTAAPERPLLTLPRACEGPVSLDLEATSWLGERFADTARSEDGSEPPAPLRAGGCAKLAFAPEIAAAPTTDKASSPSGLDFGLRFEDPGLTDPGGIAGSDLKKAVVTLPEGVTVNPSQAEGLEVCSEADFGREKAGSDFGSGCPAASKIGTTEVETPLLDNKVLRGSLFVAEPYANRFGTLLALYMTFKEPELGIGIKLAGKVEPDPRTGQLVTTFEDLPQQPFSEFRLRFREGARSPLITPPGCGDYEVEARFTPWANPTAPIDKSASFEIDSGPGGGPCPPAGPPPFAPGFSAGTLSNQAGSYSPFAMRLTRRDGDADLVRFDASLPPGVLARLAGVGRCSDARIAAARARSGKAELAAPSCPLGSRIGSALAGAGVGSQLTYVPGAVYLAGPHAGAPLSVVGIVPAVAGPFDVGTVVTRQALRVHPRTGEVTVDGKVSDPIPHILAGIPLAVRDIRVLVDRPSFTLNPTSCEPAATGALIWGGGADPFSAADDTPVARAFRFQAAGCAALGLKPRLAMRLRGGTRRGAHPALRAVLRPRPGDANLRRVVVRLPRSAFLEQSHIRTICTRVQFAASACPKGSIYGRVRVFTPLLSEPLEGPIYLRSSNNKLPDIVFDLHGLVDFEAVARVDSVRGGIRTTFTQIPDAPISRVVARFQGARKGLIVNSRDLCARKSRAAVRLAAHNDRRRKLGPVVRPTRCGKGKARRGRGGR